MNDVFAQIGAGFAGLAVGFLFFGGLWWTVRKGVASTRPATWFLGSLLLRMSATLAGFYFVGRGHWERMLLCGLGFLIARFILIWLASKSAQPGNSPSNCKEASHAP
jgi:F1F0 ATPase subunit 2